MVALPPVVSTVIWTIGVILSLVALNPVPDCTSTSPPE
jgi:hypothetical protein